MSLIKASVAYHMSEVTVARIRTEFLTMVNDEIAEATRLGFYGCSLAAIQKLVDEKYEEYPDGFESAIREAGYEIDYSMDEGCYKITWFDAQ